MPYKDPEKRRAWRVKHRAEHNAKERARRAALGEEYRAYHRTYQAAWTAKHREEYNAKERARRCIHKALKNLENIPKSEFQSADVGMASLGVIGF